MVIWDSVIYIYTHTHTHTLLSPSKIRDFNSFIYRLYNITSRITQLTTLFKNENIRDRKICCLFFTYVHTYRTAHDRTNYHRSYSVVHSLYFSLASIQLVSRLLCLHFPTSANFKNHFHSHMCLLVI